MVQYRWSTSMREREQNKRNSITKFPRIEEPEIADCKAQNNTCKERKQQQPYNWSQYHEYSKYQGQQKSSQPPKREKKSHLMSRHLMSQQQPLRPRKKQSCDFNILRETSFEFRILTPPKSHSTDVRERGRFQGCI